MILLQDAKFTISFKKLVRKNPQLQDKILEVLELLSKDPFAPSLKAHKLGGKLKDVWACSGGYDCRILYVFIENS